MNAAQRRKEKRAQKITKPAPLALRERRLQDVTSELSLRRRAASVAASLNAPRPSEGRITPKVDVSHVRRRHDLTNVSIESINHILQKAEDGSVEEKVDLWNHMLRVDAHLYSVWDSRVSPVAAADWSVSPPEVSGDPALAESAQKLSTACTLALQNISNLPALFSSLMNAVGVGYGVAEIVWGRFPFMGQTVWLPQNILPIHARRFRFDDYFELGLYDNGAAVKQLQEQGWRVTELQGRGAKLARLPAGKYIVHQPVSANDDFPSARGLVHPVARWWWVKLVCTKYNLTGAEMAANARLIGTLTQEAPSYVAQELKEGLEELAADGVIVVRNGCKVEVVEGSHAKSADVWDRLATRMDLAMTKAVIGSTLSVEIDSSGGNRAAAEVQADMTIHPRKKLDGHQIWSSLQNGAFRFIRDYNPHVFAKSTPLPKGNFHWDDKE